MAKTKKKVKIDYRHDKCKCGALKCKTSPTCRACFMKNRLKASINKKDMKKMGKHLAERSKKRIVDNKKYDRLRKELLNLEKKIFPKTYSYRMFNHGGQKYITFPSDQAYPVDMVRGFIETCDKHKGGGEGTQVIGMVMQIPNPIPKKTNKKLSRTPKKAKKGYPVKKAKKNARRNKHKPNRRNR